MGKNNSKHFFVTLASILIASTINYVISFLLTPYITETIGTEAYGYVSLANTYANYAAIFTVAINSIATRYITVEIHNNNVNKAKEYFSSLFFADIILDIFIFIVSFLIIVNLEKVLVISPSLQAEVKLLFAFTIINFGIVSASTVFTSSTVIRNRLDIGSFFKAVSYIGNGIFLLFGFKLLGAHVYIVGIGLICSSVILFATNFIYTKKHSPELKVRRRFIKAEAIKEVVLKGVWYSFNSLGNVLNSGLDLWVSNLLLSAFQMGQLAIVKTLATIPVAIYQLAAQPLQPILLKQYAEEDKDGLINTFSLGIKVNGYLANVMFAFFFAYGMNYYKLWTPSQDIGVLTTLTIITLIGGIIEGTVTPLYYVYVLTLKNKIPCIVTLVSGILNVMSMYLLIKFFNGGLNVVVGTTMVLTWIINFIFNPVYSAKCLNIKMGTFFPIIIRSLLSCMALSFAAKVLADMINPISWIHLIIMGMCICVIGLIVHLVFVMNKSEINAIYRMVVRRKL